ncbi:MAG: YbaK/EbsC family protein [Candidatus Pacebacteria bacterium]|nr:YbaK/EbsC family protein [Candidatus Paceibacterota bacterium]
MPVETLKNFLDSNSIKYVRIIHSPAYTSQEIAASAHIPGKELAKTVIVKLDGDMAMAVLPAPAQVDLDALAKAAGASNADLATEDEFRDAFQKCEVGAMPPFGNLYGLPVYVDDSLLSDTEIAFNAGTHAELLRMPLEDYRRLVNPKVATFAAQ